MAVYQQCFPFCFEAYIGWTHLSLNVSVVPTVPWRKPSNGFTTIHHAMCSHRTWPESQPQTIYCPRHSAYSRFFNCRTRFIRFVDGSRIHSHHRGRTRSIARQPCNDILFIYPRPAKRGTTDRSDSMVQAQVQVLFIGRQRYQII